jgi:O-antigen/teichoic acid export membrane protein
VSLLSNIGLYALASLVARAAGVVRSFWLAALLGPAVYGDWVFMLLLSAYAPILSLGTVEALLKRVPFFNGRADASSAREIERGAFAFTFIVSATFTALVALVGVTLRSLGLASYVLPTRLMLLAVAISGLSSFSYYRLQAYSAFHSVSLITTVRSVATLVLQLAFAYPWGLTGAVLGYAVAEAVVCAFSFRRTRPLPRLGAPVFSANLFRRLITVGFPISIIWWTFIIQTSIDRIVSMTMLGSAPTGYYGIGMSITGAYLLFPDAINQVLYPSINEQFGRTQQAGDLVPLVLYPARIMSLLLPLLTCGFFLVMPVLFQYVIPQYAPGLVAAQILVIGALFGALTRGGVNLLVSIDRQRTVLGLVAASVLANLLGNVLLVKLGFGIEGIAVSTLVSTFGLSTSVWWLVLRSVDTPARSRWGVMGNLFGPALLFALVAVGSSGVTALVHPRSLAGSLAIVAAQIGVYGGVVACVPSFRQTLRGALRDLATALAQKVSFPRTRGRDGGPDPQVQREGIE